MEQRDWEFWCKTEKQNDELQNKGNYILGKGQRVVRQSITGSRVELERTNSKILWSEQLWAVGSSSCWTNLGTKENEEYSG